MLIAEVTLSSLFFFFFALQPRVCSCEEFGNSSLLTCLLEWGCLCSRRNVDCSRLNLTSVSGAEWPSLDPKTHVIFSRNKVEILPADGVFPASAGPLIESLDLSQNTIAVIEDGAFAGLSALRFLYLQNNRLLVLTPDTFRGLASLERLDLSFNVLKDVNPSALGSCAGLTELILRYTSLQHVDVALLAPLAHLDILDLNNIGLSSLHEEVFANNTLLSSLDLSSNPLTRVPSEALSSLLNLVRLDLSDTSLVEVPPRAFFSLSSLQNLALNTMDRLETIDAHAFEGLESLRELSCSFNHKLKSIDGAAFRVSGTEHVQYTSHVEQVRLRQNELSSLDQLLLPWMHVEVLDVQENPWRCDCHLQWMKKIIADKDPSSHMSKCSSPPELRDRRVIDVPLHEFVCPAHQKDAMLSMAFFLVAFLVVLSVVGVLGCWKIRTCAKCRETYQQRYMKLSTVGRDAERVEMECPREGSRARHLHA